MVSLAYEVKLYASTVIVVIDERYYIACTYIESYCITSGSRRRSQLKH